MWNHPDLNALGGTNVQPSIREAAVLLSCLPTRYAARVLSRLSDKQSRALRQELQRVTELAAPERVQAVNVFLREVDSTPGGDRQRRFDMAEAAPPSFHFLHRLAPGEVARLIGQELPRTQAVVLAQLPPRFAAQILLQLSDPQRMQVVQQLATLDGEVVVALPELAVGLQQMIARHRSDSHPKLPGPHLLARMLAQTQGDARQRLAQTLQECGITPADIG